jgi:lipopolysaccharide/colanic/teichoic acid biosynthesis glycosyltransferase
MKRLFDIFLAVILLLLCLLPGLIIVIFIVILSPGNVFFVHKRLGKDEKEFGLIKFRTMTQTNQEHLCITIKGDKRVTGIGRFLRIFKLDELPQLLNVLSGSMSFVGPRPEVADYIKLYTPKQREILKYKPGLVDPATLKYRNEEEILAAFDDPQKGYIESILPDKIKISLEYQRNRGFFSDFRIILQTVLAIFQKR